jgi:DNA-binding transcriptional MocR family regulator
VRATIRSGQLASGDTLPSVLDLARLQGLKPGTVRHAFLALAEEGLLRIPLRGTRLRRAVDPGASADPAGLTARGQAEGQARSTRVEPQHLSGGNRNNVR